MDMMDLEQGIMKRSEHERLMKQQEDACKREIERIKKRCRQIFQEQKDNFKIEWEKREKHILDIQSKNIDRHTKNTAMYKRLVDEVRRLRDENRRLKELLQRQNAASSLMGMRSPRKRKRNLKNLQNLPYH